MGGRGSTRWKRRYEPPRPLISDVLTLRARYVARAFRSGEHTPLGAMRWTRGRLASQWGGRHVQVREGLLDLEPVYPGAVRVFSVLLVVVPQPFGGDRYWLVCTGGCGKFRRALYLWRGLTLGCRRCEGLVYPSQRATRRQRAGLRRDKCARRILSYWDSSERPPDRPKGAWRKRYTSELQQWRIEHALAMTPEQRRRQAARESVRELVTMRRPKRRAPSIPQPFGIRVIYPGGDD